MPPERHCLHCNTLMEKDWASSNKKYCDASCMASFFYRLKYKAFYDERYKRQKREWEKSENGKRAGLKLYQWRKLPKEWR